MPSKITTTPTPIEVIEAINSLGDDLDAAKTELSEQITEALTIKRDRTSYVADANLNSLLTDGSYACAGTLTNAPVSTTYCIVNVYDSSSTSRIIQECYIPQSDNTARVFNRCVNGATFGAWQEMPRFNSSSHLVFLSGGELWVD